MILKGLFSNKWLGWFSKRLGKTVKHRINHVFMSLAFKGHRRDIVLPKNFNLESHLALYPPNEYGFATSSLKFSKDKIYYFLSLLTTIPARNKDLIDEEGWIPIHTKTIRDKIKDIGLYKDYLIRTGVLECDNIYIPKVKSRCYRWSKSYIQSGFQVCNVVCKHEEEAYFMQEEADEELINLPYLYHWYNDEKLGINPIVQQYAEATLNDKMGDKSKWSINIHTNQLKNPIVQYMAALTNILR